MIKDLDALEQDLNDVWERGNHYSEDGELYMIYKSRIKLREILDDIKEFKKTKD